jgi:uncharacterized protein (DUF736 family)
MAYEQKELTGSLFKNDRKETDSHPDYKGSALINGVSHWLDAWINTAADGSKYMSLKMKPKEARAFAAEPPGERGNVVGGFMDAERDLDDDVPF